MWKFYEAYLTLCFRDFFNEKKNPFAAVVLNGRSPGRVDFRLKKKWSQGTTTTLLERFIILESSKIRERRLSYRYSWFNICVIFFNKDLESSFFFKKLDRSQVLLHHAYLPLIKVYVYVLSYVYGLGKYIEVHDYNILSLFVIDVKPIYVNISATYMSTLSKWEGLE